MVEYLECCIKGCNNNAQVSIEVEDKKNIYLCMGHEELYSNIENPKEWRDKLNIMNKQYAHTPKQ